MNYRLVKLIQLHKSKDEKITRVSTVKIQLKNKNDTIYDSVEQYKKEIGSKIKETIKEVKKPILLREIINLHNVNGIKNVNQIKTMVKKIKSGKQILSPNGLPNIKLVKTVQSEWILFDGHHSLLAYMITGKHFYMKSPILLSKTRIVT